eukprot:2970839-Pyramimonas_sp.AAC.1
MSLREASSLARREARWSALGLPSGLPTPRGRRGRNEGEGEEEAPKEGPMEARETCPWRRRKRRRG